MNKNLVSGLIVLCLIGVGVVAYFVTHVSQTKPADNAQPVQGSQQTALTTVSLAKNAVTIQGFKYSQSTLTVKVGDSVTWTNQDSVGHSATADDKSFDTGVLSKGQSGSITFAKAGTFSYHCSVHPNMKATIVVQP